MAYNNLPERARLCSFFSALIGEMKKVIYAKSYMNLQEFKFRILAAKFRFDFKQIISSNKVLKSLAKNQHCLYSFQAEFIRVEEM